MRHKACYDTKTHVRIMLADDELKCFRYRTFSTIPIHYASRGALSHVLISMVPGTTSLVRRPSPVTRDSRAEGPEIRLTFPKTFLPSNPLGLIQRCELNARSSHDSVGYDEVYLRTLYFNKGLNNVLRGMEMRGLPRNVRHEVVRKSPGKCRGRLSTSCAFT